MSVPTTQAVNLPAHIAKLANTGLSLNETITGGMKSGGHPSIGIKASKWRLRENGAEELVESFTLDVIIVNANKYLSKVFYMGAYTGEEGKAPDCFSDNGTAPSAQAEKPQATNCAACPHNAWGSKVSPSGAKIKACADYKKLAVVLADDPERNVYELRIPGASLKELNDIMTRLINNRVPIPAVIFRLSFDSKVDYPKVLFKPTGYVTEEQAVVIESWINSQEAKEAVGETDIPAVVTQTFAKAPVIEKKPEPVAEDPMAFLNSTTPKTEEAPKRRGRPPKTTQEEPEQMTMDMPGVTSAAKSTPIDPNSTDADLDKILAGIL
ncbi:MAG: hypothetical protein KGL39_11650 [Patescibacteria group bacterium]|nr:hypothetical protein [Patescibacteria group bacterium]